MRDLLVITPSRGRPERLREMLRACLSLSEAQTDIWVVVDVDDPALPHYDGDMWPHVKRDGRLTYTRGPRVGLGASTNWVAHRKPRHRALASLGDDHVPRTQGWDRLLLEALDAMGGTGIAYGDDKHQGKRLPTAPVISADIVEALGWMCEPSLRHWYVDNVWRDLGLAAGCLAWVPGVTIEHLHPAAGKAPDDAVYAASLAGAEADRVAYERWRRERMAEDAGKIQAVMRAAP